MSGPVDAAYLPGCDCYVATLPPEIAFGLRRGAHDTLCPVYRPSMDPCDRASDRAARAYLRGDKLAPHRIVVAKVSP